jgi:serine/threonine protein kinase/tetratricopeptide (TPR) repeat protein
VVTSIGDSSQTPSAIDSSVASLCWKFEPRYQITKLLGIGGMGAVYQAWDNELSEHVALKVIRPDLADKGSGPERQFKRELQLARQVTHKNVIRIHDMGEVSGTKYISMPFVEGADLATILRERRTLPVGEAISLAKQIAAGLSAAHEVGVVHRDLKPANILVSGDLAIITDFGVAYSLSGGPSEGGIVGTLRYMAPEQAKGLPVDHRADVYAFGLIFHEMLSGARFNADNTTEILPGRRDDGLHDFEPQFGWPNGLNRILTRCLAVDPMKRYGSAAMLVDDLGTLDENGSIVARPTYLHVPSSWPFIGGRMIARGTAAATLALLIAVPVVGGAAYFTSARLTRNALVQPDPRSVLIADFDNQTGDDVFNQLIESALSVSLEGASFIDSYSRPDAHKLLAQVSEGQRLDVPNARGIAQREGIDIVVGGAIRSQGSRFKIDVEVVDPVPGTVLVSRSVTVDDRDQVLGAIGQVGAEIRAALGDTTSQSAVANGRETFTAASLEAASAYMKGQELLNASRYKESIPLFTKATELDPQFGRAYASWAVSSFYIGDRQNSNELYNKAFGLTERMSERERLRTFGTYYLTVGQAYQEAITNYTKLVEAYPADRVGFGNLAVAYSYTLNFPKALEAGRRALALYPASLKYRSNVAWYALYSSDFASAATEAKRVIETDASYFQAYTPLALSTIVTASEPGAPIYERMATTDSRGSSRAAIGLADLAMYEGRYADAISSLPSAIAEDTTAGDGAGAAAKYIALGEAQLAQGARDRAIAAAEQALRASTGETVRLSAARIFIGARREAQALELAMELSQQTQGYSRAYADIVQADVALARGKPADAVEGLRAAQKAADLWLVHFLLGRAYVEAGQFPAAIAEFDVCVRRRGEATAIFLDDIPSVRYLAEVPYWQGRAQEGLGLSAQAAANYQQFLKIRDAAKSDALVKDARTRVAKLAL